MTDKPLTKPRPASSGTKTSPARAPRAEASPAEATVAEPALAPGASSSPSVADSSADAAAAAASVVVAPAAVATLDVETPEQPAPAVAEKAASPKQKAAVGWGARLSALLWVLPVMLLAAVVTRLALTVAAPSAQEAVVTGYIRNLLTRGEVASWAATSQPPLGWMQSAAWVQAFGGFERWDVAVLAAREAMIPFVVLTVGLAWLLARRLGLSRFTATIAAGVLAVSPFALAQHAVVSLENVAAPWVVLAFVLATARHRQTVLFALSAAAFVVAVLSAGTALLALPFLAWTMVSSTRAGARVRPLVAASAVLVVLGVASVLVLANGGSAGGPLPAGGAPAVLATWWTADPVLLALLALGAACGLALPRLRPTAAFTIASLALLAVPGLVGSRGLPALLLPFGVVVLVGAVASAVNALREPGTKVGLVAVTLVAATAVGIGVAVPFAFTRAVAADAANVDIATGTQGSTDAADGGSPVEAWLLANVGAGDTVLVDEATGIALLEAGWSPAQVAFWDPAGALPETWTDADWLVAPEAAGASVDADSVVVASFDGTDVRRVLPGSAEAERAAASARADIRISYGGQIVQNPDLRISDEDAALLRDGQVDDRIVSVLGALTAFGPVEVAGFPIIDGESGPRRQVAITLAGNSLLAEGGALTEAGRTVVADLTDRYAPDSADADGDALVLRYPLTFGEPTE